MLTAVAGTASCREVDATSGAPAGSPRVRGIAVADTRELATAVLAATTKMHKT
jgi:hypothetical protein